MLAAEPKIVDDLILPATSERLVTLIATDLALIEPTTDGLVLREVAPSVDAGTVVADTAADLIVPPDLPEMLLRRLLRAPVPCGNLI